MLAYLSIHMAKGIFHSHPPLLRICTRMGMKVPLKPCHLCMIWAAAGAERSTWERDERDVLYPLTLIDLQIRTYFVSLFFSLRDRAMKEDSNISNRGN